MTDYIIIAVIAAVIGLAVLYIVRQKKHGAKCIGCPSSHECAHRNSCNGCSCGCDEK